jgi:hypothetical protein
LEERLNRLTPNVAQNRLLKNIPVERRLEEIEIDFFESANISFISEHERVWKEGFGVNNPTLLADYCEVYVRSLTNDLDRIVALASRQTFHNALEINKEGFIQKRWGLNLYSWGLYSFTIQYGSLCSLWQRNRYDEAKTTARLIIGVAKITGVPEYLISNPWFARILAAAHAVSGEGVKARDYTNWLLNERSDFFDKNGLNGIQAMGWVDPDRAAEMVMNELSKNPEWSAIDRLVAFYNLNFQVIDHPKIEEYLVQQGKWVDYLADRSPVYAKHLGQK